MEAKKDLEAKRLRTALEKSLAKDEVDREKRNNSIQKAKAEFIRQEEEEGEKKKRQKEEADSRRKGPYSTLLSRRVAIEQATLASLPPPRSPRTIEVNFTERKSITPKRDTQVCTIFVYLYLYCTLKTGYINKILTGSFQIAGGCGCGSKMGPKGLRVSEEAGRRDCSIGGKTFLLLPGRRLRRRRS